MPGTPETGLYLAFDYGERRIGVAVGNRWNRQARPLTVVTHKASPPWKELQELVGEWQPQALVVGLPLHHDATEQEITRKARAFAAELETRCGIPAKTVDERWTSRDAASRLKAARHDEGIKRRLKKGDKDSVAAQLILRDYLGTLP